MKALIGIKIKSFNFFQFKFIKKKRDYKYVLLRRKRGFRKHFKKF